MKGMLSRDRVEEVAGRGVMNNYLIVLRLIGVIGLDANGCPIAHNST